MDVYRMPCREYHHFPSVAHLVKKKSEVQQLKQLLRITHAAHISVSIYFNVEI